MNIITKGNFKLPLHGRGQGRGFIFSIALIVSAIPVSAQSLYPGIATDLQKVQTVAPAKALAFNLKDVRLLPSRFLDNMKRDSAWIAAIPAKSIAHSFQNNAGVFSDREGGYMTVRKPGGWESLDCDLRGHTTGHLLSALAYMYASTGSTMFKAKADSIVNMLDGVQKAFGTGYVSAFPEELINRNIRGEGVWAPWYTLHKVLSGLVDQYVYCGNRQALDIAVNFTDWAYGKLKPLDEETRRRMLRNEFGGVNEAFYNIYALTGSEKSLWLARYFYHNDVVDPVRHHEADFGTKHTNTFIPKIIAEARNYELTGSTESRDAAQFFWQQMVDNHTFVTGSLSDKEHFFNPAEMSKHLSGYTGETCCTYNMLKLSRHLFCWTADPRVADYYERALYNHILGQQDTVSGMVCYFLPLLSGAYKVYSTPYNSFWCCVGSGFENHAKYAEAIYYQNATGLFVNLYIPSVLTWEDKGITLTQTTRFPENDVTTLKVSASQLVKTSIRLRCPSWCNGAEVSINGKKVKIKVRPGTYITLDRTWQDGDEIKARFPMRLTVERTKDNPNRAAVLFGPVVLAGEKGTEGMNPPAPMSDPTLYNDYYTYNFHVPAGLKTTLRLDAKNPARSLKRLDGTLKFTSADGETLSPFYDVHRQRYVVYWDLK